MTVMVSTVWITKYYKIQNVLFFKKKEINRILMTVKERQGFYSFIKLLFCGMVFKEKKKTLRDGLGKQ